MWDFFTSLATISFLGRTVPWS